MQRSKGEEVMDFFFFKIFHKFLHEENVGQIILENLFYPQEGFHLFSIIKYIFK